VQALQLDGRARRDARRVATLVVLSQHSANEYTEGLAGAAQATPVNAERSLDVFANGWSANMFRNRDCGKSWQRLQLSGTRITRIHP